MTVYHYSSDSAQQRAARVSAAARRRRAEERRERDERQRLAALAGRPFGHHEECGCEECRSPRVTLSGAPECPLCHGAGADPETGEPCECVGEAGS